MIVRKNVIGNEWMSVFESMLIHRGGDGLKCVVMRKDENSLKRRDIQALECI